MKIDSIRRDYLKMGLEREMLNECPFQQFDQWLQDAVNEGLTDPTAMVVATVSPNGQPSQRIVLLKQVTEQGFVFFTNTESRKAQEIKTNSHVSLHFPWHSMERQVIIQGQAISLPSTDVVKYFLSRPKASQLAAWASEQSRPVSSRSVLMEKFAQVKNKFAQGEVPLPSFWGGYCVIPTEIEFWQGGADRLHDRFVYRKPASESTDGSWEISRLNP